MSWPLLHFILHVPYPALPYLTLLALPCPALPYFALPNTVGHALLCPTVLMAAASVMPCLKHPDQSHQAAYAEQLW